MSTTDRQFHFGLLVLISFVAFSSGTIIDQTVRWTDHYEGFVNGVFHMPLFGIAWIVWLLPWSLIIFGLYRWRKWKRFRAVWVLAPAVFCLFQTLVGLAVRPPTPAHRFAAFAGTELPKDAKDLRCYFSGGGLADYWDTYDFHCASNETARLISAMHLTRDSGFTQASCTNAFPDCLQWASPVRYSFGDEDANWYYELTTDANHEKVHIVIYCL